MKTQRSLRGQISPDVLAAIADGTASADLREAYRRQLVAAQNEPLLAAPITTQTDWVDAAPRESGGQSLMF